MKRPLVALMIIMISGCTSQESISTQIPTIMPAKEVSTETPQYITQIPTQIETITPTQTQEITATSTPRPTNTLTPTPVYEELQVISDENANFIQILTELKISADGWLYGLEFAPHQNLLVASHSSNTIYQWNFPSIEDKISIQNRTENLYVGGGDRIAISSDGEEIATSASRRVIIRDLDHGDILLEPKTNLFVDDFMFTANGSMLIIAGRDQENLLTMIEIWNLEDNKKIVTLDEIPAWYGIICSLTINPDSTVLAAGFCDHQMLIWELSGEYASLGRVLGMYGPYTCYSHFCESSNTVRFLPNSNILASGTYNSGIPFRDIFTGSLELVLSTKRKVEFEDQNTGKIIYREYGPDVDDMEFSSDGKLLAIAGWSEIQLRRVKTGELLAYFEFPENQITNIAFSFDGRLLAASSLEGNIYILGINE